MKKILLFLALFITIEIHAIDKEKFVYQFDAGIDISIPYKENIVWIPAFHDQPFTNFISDNGYFHNVSIGYLMKRNWLLYTGVTYSQSSLEYYDKYQNVDIKIEAKIQSAYLRVPLLLSYEYSEIPFMFGFGTYVGIMTKEKETGTVYVSDAVSYNFDYGNKMVLDFDPINKENSRTVTYNKFDFGIITQVLYNLKLNETLSTVLFTRFNFGLTNTLDSKEYTWKNYSLTFGVGWNLKYNTYYNKYRNSTGL
jgi:hypothetical protein